MKTTLIAAALAAACLAGCQTTTPGTGPISSGTGTIANIITGTQTACKFVPTVATVSAALSAAPAASTIDTIVQALCAAVAPLASGPGSSRTPGYAYGVPVRGRFVP
jgi:hypothetical protein